MGLLHGTFLVDFDLKLIPELLPFPSKTPDYRGTRSHLEFVRNIPVSRARLKHALAATWNAEEVLSFDAHAPIEALIQTRYGRADWNFRI